MDNDKLNAAVDTIAVSLAQPKISIAFTIKNADAFHDEILKDAARNARRQAEILCAASGVKLGKLLRVNYSWNEFDIRHEPVDALLAPSGKNSFDFRPDEIKANDSVDFIWEIE